MKTPVFCSVRIGGNIEEVREQRKFAETKPREFQEDDELYAEKFRKKQEFAEKMGADREKGATVATIYTDAENVALPALLMRLLTLLV